VTVFADKPTVVAGGPDGNSIKFELTQNGKPLPSAVAFAKLSTGVLQQNSSERVSAVFPVINTTIKPGDKLGIEISFYGLNPEAAPTVKYKVGGDSNTRLVFIIHLASLAEVELPPEVGPWDIRPLEGFDFREAKKKDATVTEVTLQAFQFGFQGAPVVVANGSKVVLHLYVDESFSASQEGHGAHAHGAPASGGGEHAGHVAWDQVTMAALHGFNLASLDPKLHTVLFDSLVVTMNLTADRPGNYTFMCTVFCGSGHGTMLDRLTIQGPPAPAESSGPPALAPPTAKTPALAVGGMLVALLVAAVAYPRQGRR